MQSESDTELKNRLKALHRHLQDPGELDAELQMLLRQLDGDIEKAMIRREQADPDATTYGLASRTQELAARFALRHPRVEASLRELGNILASMGI